MTADVLNLLANLNPTSGQVAALFVGLSKIPPNILQVLLKAMDENLVRKIAVWSQTFIQHMNDLGPAPIDSKVIQQSLESGDSDDFFNVMQGTRYIGPQLRDGDLDTASNAITKAIKANDWQQAVQVGLTLARFIPAL